MSQGTIRTAYVICQGEIVICQQPNRPGRIYLLAPEVDGHIYKAGAYLEEREVQPHTPLTLEKVVGASAFKPPENVLTFGKTGTPLVDRARLVVDLPAPLNIHSGVKENLEHSNVEIMVDGEKIEQRTTEPALILILEYQWTGSDLPYLKAINGESGRWDAGKGTVDGYAAIHVYATHEQAVMTPMHAEDAFRKAAEVVSVKKAIITWNRNAKIPLVRTEYGLGGLLWNQINLLYSERASVENNLTFGRSPLREPGSRLKPDLSPLDTSGNCGPVI